MLSMVKLLSLLIVYLFLIRLKSLAIRWAKAMPEDKNCSEPVLLLLMDKTLTL